MVRIFRMPRIQLKWKSCAIALIINRNSVNFKKSVLQSQHRRGEFINERVKVLSQRCCYVSSAFLSGYPWPLLVGIRCISAYHLDYTSAHNPSEIILIYWFGAQETFSIIINVWNSFHFYGNSYVLFSGSFNRTLKRMLHLCVKIDKLHSLI